jgi:HSP20 family molecular chaperone IbpA
MNHQLTNRLGGFGFFDPFFAPFFEEEHGDSSFGSLEMKTDIQDLGNGYQMDVELPGFEKKDIALNLNEGYLTISAKVNRDAKRTIRKATTFTANASLASPLAATMLARSRRRMSKPATTMAF